MSTLFERTDVVETVRDVISLALERVEQIQSFYYSEPERVYVIRDLIMDHKMQELWRGKSGEACHIELRRLRETFVAEAAVRAVVGVALRELGS